MTAEMIPSPEVTDAEAEMARAAQRCIMASLDHSNAAFISLVSDGESGPAVDLPPKALRLIAEILGLMSERKPVVFLHESTELSTVEAANFLQVSRPFLIKEIEAGRLPCRKVGTHRRLSLSDVIAYERRSRADRKGALKKLAENENELGLEY